MELLKINDLVVPNLTQYDVDYADVDGEKSQVEDGTTYLEQVRVNVPKIKVGWTNLTQEEVTAITSEFSASGMANITYFYGIKYTMEMIASDRKLKLKHIDDRGQTYWDLSFTLEG